MKELEPFVPGDRSFEQICKDEGWTFPGYPVVKPNGKRAGAPLSTNDEVPKVKLKVKKGRLVVKIKYWRSYEQQLYLMRCFGIDEPADVGMALRYTLWEKLLPANPDASDVVDILRYLHNLRPLNLLAAHQALQLYLVQETIVDTRSLIRGTYGYERSGYVRDLDRLIGAYAKIARG